MEDKKPEIVININGGSVHILLDATHVVQQIHVYSSPEQGEARTVPIPDESSRLPIYI